MQIIFEIIILVMSVVVHEVAHGYTAYALGDPTAKFSGRLTLNPIKHLDFFGSILLPGMLALSNLPVIGWAKPVPINEHNLTRGRWGTALVAMAGPLSNIFLAIVFGLALRFGFGTFSPSWLYGLSLVVVINLALAIFNLLPVPLFDGSRVLAAILPYRYSRVINWFERYSLVIFLLLIVFASYIGMVIGPLVSLTFQLITGSSL